VPEKPAHEPPRRGVRRIPQQSVIYDRIVPLAMLILGGLLVAIVIAAFGFLLGWIQY
jgi:uncharacterized protein (DUF697 family)